MLYIRKPIKKNILQKTYDSIVKFLNKIEYGDEEEPVNLKLRIYNRKMKKDGKFLYYIIRVNEKISIGKILSNIDTIEYIYYNRDKWGGCKHSFVDLERLLKWDWRELIKLLKEIGDFEEFDSYMEREGRGFYEKWK